MTWADDLLRDIAYSFRILRSAPLVSLAVVVTLTIGIGLDTGAFTVINGLLLRPRCDSDPQTIARLYAEYSVNGEPREYGGQFSPAAYATVETQSKVLAQLAAWRTDAVLVEDDAVRSLAMEVSCNFFSVYGLQQTRAGRLFRLDECARESTSQVVVIAEELWRDRFGADPKILGKTILLNRLPFTVIGITPLDFSGRLRGPGLWIPVAMQSRATGHEDIFHNENRPALWLEGRLARGKWRSDLAAELSVIATRLRSDDRETKTTIDVTDGSMIQDPNVRSFGFWLMLLVVSGLTLLLAVSCATTAVLLLARAAERRREIAVRISLGAARSRILRQLLAETLLLALAAGTLGAYLALQVPITFKKLVPAQMPHYAFTLDWHIFGYLATVTLGATVLAALAPAFECLRQDVWLSLKGSVASVRTGKIGWSIRELLVVVQVCFSVILMVVSAAYIRIELSIIGSDPGFNTEQVLQVPIQLPPVRYNAAAAQHFYIELQQRIEALPTVESVATASESPLGSDSEQISNPPQFRLATQSMRESHSAIIRRVSSNYFSTLGIPLLHGENFSASGDTSSAVISQAFASAFWPGRDPVGQIVIAPDESKLRVIGVVRDTRTESFGHHDGPCIYLLRSAVVPGDLLLLRFRGQPEVLQSAVNSLVHDLDPQMFVLSTTLRAAISDMAERLWVIGKMLLFVAFVAAGLALFGIYGVVGYSVTRRTREFGIRAALGATRSELMRLVFVSGSRPVLAGTVAGLLLGAIFLFSFATALRNAPIAIPARDPLPYCVVALFLLISASAAMAGHARRAARIEPLVALREE